MAVFLTIINPVAPSPKATLCLTPVLSAVHGTRVGFRVQWKSFDVFMQEMENVLREDYGVADVFWWNLGNIDNEAGARAGDPDNFNRQADKFAEESDWAILGLAA